MGELWDEFEAAGVAAEAKRQAKRAARREARTARGLSPESVLGRVGNKLQLAFGFAVLGVVLLIVGALVIDWVTADPGPLCPHDQAPTQDSPYGYSC